MESSQSSFVLHQPQVVTNQTTESPSTDKAIERLAHLQEKRADYASRLSSIDQEIETLNALLSQEKEGAE